MRRITTSAERASDYRLASFSVLAENDMIINNPTLQDRQNSLPARAGLGPVASITHHNFSTQRERNSILKELAPQGVTQGGPHESLYWSLADDHNTHGIVARDAKGNILGTAGYFQASRVRDPDVMLKDLYVAHDAKGTGVGGELLQHAARAAASNYGSLTVKNMVSSAKGFYEKHGINSETGRLGEGETHDLASKAQIVDSAPNLPPKRPIEFHQKKFLDNLGAAFRYHQQNSPHPADRAAVTPERLQAYDGWLGLSADDIHQSLKRRKVLTAPNPVKTAATWDGSKGNLSFEYIDPHTDNPHLTDKSYTYGLDKYPTAQHRVNAYFDGNHAGYMDIDEGDRKVPHGLINMVKTNPDYRGMGIGRALGEHFENEVGITPVHNSTNQTGNGTQFASATPQWPTFDGRKVVPTQKAAFFVRQASETCSYCDKAPAQQALHKGGTKPVCNGCVGKAIKDLGKDFIGLKRTASVPEKQDVESEHTSGMIALIPAKKHLDEMTVDGGDPAEQLHLTLVILGEGEDWSSTARTELLEWVDGEVGKLGEVTGSVFAHAQFNPDDDKSCSVYLVSQIKEEIEDFIDNVQEEFDLPEQHTPWIPHITAGFDLDPNLLDFIDEIEFEYMRVVWAGETYDFPLNSKIEKTAFYVRSIS